MSWIETRKGGSYEAVMRIFRSDGEFTTSISSFAISTIELVLNDGTPENELLRQDLRAPRPTI